MDKVNPELLRFLRKAQANLKPVELFVQGTDYAPFGSVEICGEEAVFIGRQDRADLASGSNVWVDLRKVWGWRVSLYGAAEGEQ